MNRGFTLIELLVALALLALLGGLVLGGLDLGLQTRTRLESTTTTTREVNAALQTLRRLVEQTVPPSRQWGRDGPPALTGDRDGMALISRPPGAAAAPPQPLRLLLREGRLLIAPSTVPAAARQETDAGTGEREETTRLLLDNVEGIELSYFGAADPDGPVRWHDDWRRTQVLPQRVRLQLRFDGRDWPALIVMPRRESLLR